jgi:hypothetical protein
MGILETIQKNPQAASAALISAATALVTCYFTLVGHPEKSDSIIKGLSDMAVPIGTAITIVMALKSGIHFSRGPAPLPATQPPKA